MRPTLKAIFAAGVLTLVGGLGIGVNWARTRPSALSIAAASRATTTVPAATAEAITSAPVTTRTPPPPPTPVTQWVPPR